MAGETKPSDLPKTDGAPAKMPANEPTGDGGKRSQLDEARDEGAGKDAVPVDDVTTANDT